MGASDPGGLPDPARAPGRRPRVVLFDVFETMLQVEALRSRFVDVGRPEHEWELFFARTLRDGMALTLAGGARPFSEVARAALRTTTGHTLSEDALDHVLAGFRELPPHPDVEPALMALARARIPAYAFTHGTAAVACDALDRAGLRTYLRGVHSSEEIRSFKPRPARLRLGLPAGGDPAGPGGAGGRALLGRARRGARRPGRRARHAPGGRGVRRGGAPARRGGAPGHRGGPPPRPAGLNAAGPNPHAPRARCRGSSTRRRPRSAFSPASGARGEPGAR